jgi:hypothetical protein
MTPLITEMLAKKPHQTSLPQQPRPKRKKKKRKLT